MSLVDSNLSQWRKRVGPVIGHMKHDNRMIRNFLKGVDGDKTNAIMAAAGFNPSASLRTGFPEIDGGRQRPPFASFFRPIVADIKLVDASDGVQKFVFARIGPHPTDKYPGKQDFSGRLRAEIRMCGENSVFKGRLRCGGSWNSYSMIGSASGVY
jgi:hypothetical protein